MYLVRAKNSITGVVYEIDSNTHPELLQCSSTAQLLYIAAYEISESFNDDDDFDSIEVVKR